MRRYLTILEPPGVARALEGAVRPLLDHPPTLAIEDCARTCARLACGDFDAIRALLRDPAPAPALPLVVACYVAWTGDLPAAAAVWTLVHAATDALLADHDPAAGALRFVTCRLLERTATDLGEPNFATRLRTAARQIAPLRAEEDDDAVFRYLPEHAAQPEVRVVSDVVDRLLGIRPDAPRARLRLRPRFEGEDLVARDIPFGDARISFELRLEPGGLTCRVEQEAGAIPVTLLLEPLLAGAPMTAEVDGRPADLVPRVLGDRILVPVQLVLDQARTLNLRGERLHGP